MKKGANRQLPIRAFLPNPDDAQGAAVVVVVRDVTVPSLDCLVVVVEFSVGVVVVDVL
ncbi:MAG TPA: hypothetical protein VFB15_10175 [Candidatus Binataceae bacterium]|nr:hypothetical protein [Candidatus Binataceae bacterium]